MTSCEPGMNCIAFSVLTLIAAYLSGLLAQTPISFNDRNTNVPVLCMSGEIIECAEGMLFLPEPYCRADQVGVVLLTGTAR
jgi:hypothetical protein